MRARTLGNTLMVAALVIYAIEQLTRNLVSSALGQLYCGDQYLSEGGFPIWEKSCGFEMDLYLAVLLLVLLFSGLCMRLLARYRATEDSALEL